MYEPVYAVIIVYGWVGDAEIISDLTYPDALRVVDENKSNNNIVMMLIINTISNGVVMQWSA